MGIPKIISKNNHEYILIKEYPNHVMYMDMLTHVKECFSRYDLGMVKEIVEKPKGLKKIHKI